MYRNIIVLLSVILFSGYGLNAWAGGGCIREAMETQIVKSYFLDAQDAKQANLIFSLFASDAQQHFNGYLNLVGVTQIYQNIAKAALIFPSFHTDIYDITVNGKMAYARVMHTATCVDTTVPGFPGGPQYFPSRVGPVLLKGQTLQWNAMAQFKFNDNLQIQEEWIVRDELQMLIMAGTLTFAN